jgi:hypothetical protein
MSDRLESARAWIADVHPHARHLERTLDWLVDLDPEAATATRIAAVTHDIERAFPDPGSQVDPIQAADSLSFLEVMVPVVERWVTDGLAPPERAAEKLRLMRRRISPSLERPQALADPMLAAGLERIDGVGAQVAEP